TNVNGTLFFRANDGTYGYEVWQSDGTSSGTSRVSDINPGSSGSNPRSLTNVNGTLFFSAHDGSPGYDSLHLGGPSLATLSASSVPEGSAAFTLTVGGDFFDGTATVLWNNTALTTQLVSSTQLQALVPASLLAEEGTATITVQGDDGSSNSLPFTITD